MDVEINRIKKKLLLEYISLMFMLVLFLLTTIMLSAIVYREYQSFKLEELAISTTGGEAYFVLVFILLLSLLIMFLTIRSSIRLSNFRKKNSHFNFLKKQMKKEYLKTKEDINLSRSFLFPHIEVGYTNELLYVLRNIEVLKKGLAKSVIDLKVKASDFSKINPHKFYYILEKIYLDDIKYFQYRGDIKLSTNISGGGRTSLANMGVALGPVILMGGRSQQRPITTRHIKHDMRETLVKYKAAENLKEIVLPEKCFTLLEEIIPHKDYNIITGNNSNNRKELDITIIKKKLKQLDELRKDGTITEKEYSSKRTILLNKL